MAAQGERVSEAIGLCSLLDEPMVQDTPVQDIPIPEQDIVVEEQELPQMDPEAEMGAAAAAADFATPPLLRQTPSPVPSKTATDNGGAGLFSPSGIGQLMEMIT